MKKKPTEKSWLSSEEARQELGVSFCDLAHLREAGKLPYQKKGNAFFYNSGGVRKLRSKKQGRA